MGTTLLVPRPTLPRSPSYQISKGSDAWCNGKVTVVSTGAGIRNTVLVPVHDAVAGL